MQHWNKTIIGLIKTSINNWDLSLHTSIKVSFHSEAKTSFSYLIQNESHRVKILLPLFCLQTLFQVFGETLRREGQHATLKLRAQRDNNKQLSKYFVPLELVLGGLRTIIGARPEYLSRPNRSSSLMTLAVAHLRCWNPTRRARRI